MFPTMRVRNNFKICLESKEAKGRILQMSSRIVEKDKTRLFWNVQFIYELVLAKKELEAFAIKYEVDSNFRGIEILEIPSEKNFSNRTSYFEKINGLPTLYSKITKANITRSINQYLTHWFYPYKGKYHPQMIRALINIMKINPGEIILDPFIGSGTTALEAQLLGIGCIGVDISEVCFRVSKAKTETVKHTIEIEKEFEIILQKLRNIDENNNEKVIPQIQQLISDITNESVQNFFQVADLIAHSDKARRKKKNFLESFIKNSEKMLTSVKDYSRVIQENNLTLGEVNIHLGNAKNLQIESETIDGILCSPPYSIALNYVENDKHALEALGYNTTEIKEDFIGVKGSGNKKIDLYNRDLIQSYLEMDRVLKPGKYCSIVIGNARVNKEEVPTVETTINFFLDKGYTLEMNVDKIIFGLYNVMQKENILIFKKP